jgi:hypothetical protein
MAPPLRQGAATVAERRSMGGECGGLAPESLLGSQLAEDVPEAHGSLPRGLFGDRCTARVGAARHRVRPTQGLTSR